MIDSTVVLYGQTIAYTIYAIVIILLMLAFGYMITKDGKAGVLKTSVFSILVAGLVVLGVSLHIATNVTIPWVAMDLNRHDITPDKVFDIIVENHEFQLPEDMVLKVGEIVVFDVVSNDLTYGFGIFREDGTMVTQMQVVPGKHRNDLMWQFVNPGSYTIRSTEYSGPKGHQMVIKDALLVTE